VSLSPFSYNATVTADDAREDKIEVVLGDWKVRATPDEIAAIQEYIARPFGRAQRDAREARQYGYLFNRFSQAGGFTRLHVRQQRLNSAAHVETSGVPLFSGYWDLLTARSLRQGQREYVTALHLFLNPLRFVRYQPIPRRIGVRRSWPLRILKGEGTIETEGEFALDGNDNWIPATSEYDNFANAERWPQHLIRYLIGIRSAFESELERVTARWGGRYFIEENFQLRNVEVAFEFAAASPIELLWQLLEPLKEYRADNFEVREYPSDDVDRERNALCFSMKIRGGVWLRAYAKTNCRIRFEFIFDEINRRELLNEVPQPHGTPPARRKWEQLPECLAELREQAAREMNLLLQYFRVNSHIPHSQVTPLALLVRIASLIGNHELTLTIATLLVRFKTIDPRQAGPELRRALHALKRGGILRFSKAQRGYVASPRYRQPLQFLSQHDILHLTLTARIRSRRGRA
jgi:hypothetical protein